MVDKEIVSVNAAGLGNRIKSWVNCRAKCQSAKLYWPINDTVCCQFTDLFAAHECFIEEIPEHSELSGNWRLTAFPKAILPEGFATFRGQNYTDGRAIDFEYNRIPPEIRQIFVPLFRELKPSTAVISIVDEIASRFSPNTVSVHVRTWVDAPKRAYKYRIDEYFRLMDDFSNSTFFVACDSPKEIRKFKRRYPQRIIECPIHPSSDGKRPYQHALAEMYLLSKNNTLITSYASTFSEVAWWFGGAQAKVLVVQNADMDIGVDEAKGTRFLVFKIRRKLFRIVERLRSLF